MPSSFSGSSDANSIAPTSNKIPNPSRKRGRPQNADLEPYKDLVVRLFTEEDQSIIDIARKLNLQHGLDVSERTISRRLTTWNIPRKKVRGMPSQGLQDRIVCHYNKNLNDKEIHVALQAEGFDITQQRMAKLRKKLGMRRRSRYPEFREYSDEDDASLSTPTSNVDVHGRLSKPPSKKRKTPQNPSLIVKVTAFVEKYMSKYDGSHDFNHIRRVVGVAHLIYKELTAESREDEETEPGLDLQVVTLAALLHDVGDKKYLEPGQDPNTLVLSTLLSFGASEDLALQVQRIVTGVSYSSEINDPAHVKALIEKYPELAIVQDADRLDAIGAIGIGRTFTFGGAKGARNMGETIKHFDEKLEKLEAMMKTAPGKQMARHRTARLTMFKEWWEEEQKEAEGLLRYHK